MNEIKNNNLEVENASIGAHQAIEETKQIEKLKLCENMDCERYPPGWDFEEDTEENYGYGRGRQMGKMLSM